MRLRKRWVRWLRERESADIENGENGDDCVLIVAAVKCKRQLPCYEQGRISCRLVDGLHVD